MGDAPCVCGTLTCAGFTCMWDLDMCSLHLYVGP